ncbi:ABC transporter permease [candidate division KSB1 bacterium]
MRYKPPKIAKWILEIFLKREDKVSRIDDFEESYKYLVCQRGKFKAVIWYWSEIIGSIPEVINFSIYWSFAMFKNYLKTALRNIKRYRSYSILNISGLVIGFTCFVLILLYVRYELSYDKYHENADSIFRVVMKQTGNVWLGTDMWNASCGKLKPTLLENFPEVEKATRVMHLNRNVHYKNKYFIENRFFIVEPDFLEIFTFPLINGDKETALTEPLTVLITEEMAFKYFDNENPLGKTLTINNNDYAVTGILQNTPGNSHLKFDFLASYQSLYIIYEDWPANIAEWGNNNYTTYVQLRDNTNLKVLENKITQLVKTLSGRDKYNDYNLQPVTGIHLNNRINREYEPSSDIRYVYIFSAIAVFLLIIACFNYMNLSTAQAFRRAKEVGIRKVAGAHRKQISLQFLGEAVIFSMFALFISLFLIKLILPLYSTFVERDLNFTIFSSSGMVSILIVIAVLSGFISGSYPALLLSAFQPVTILKGSVRSGSRKTTAFRNTLVTFQFVISISMIVSTIVLYNQLNYIKNRNLGFQKENILTFQAYDPELKNSYETFKNELLKHPQVSDITYLNTSLEHNNWGGGGWWEGKQEDDYTNFYRLFADYNFFEFYNIKLLEGRSFSPEIVTDQGKAYILNRAAVNAIGWDRPLGKKFRQWESEEGIVIGVADDFHFQSLRLKIEPLVITLARTGNDKSYFSAKIKPDDIPGTISFIEEKYKEFSPNYPFNFSFLDDRLDRLYRTDQRLGMIFTCFTAIAIIIASLGLFGLGAFTAEKRTKEIGIRKVLGASVSSVVYMLSKEFIRWVILAAVIALPLAWYAINRWLENFAYKTTIGIDVFITALLFALFISFISVGYKSVKAGNSNPVESLKNE